jgi:hypothetical protein
MVGTHDDVVRLQALGFFAILLVIAWLVHRYNTRVTRRAHAARHTAQQRYFRGAASDADSRRIRILIERRGEFAAVEARYPHEFDLVWNLATRPDTTAPQWVDLRPKFAAACQMVSDGATPKDALIANGFRITPSPWGVRPRDRAASS